MDVCVFGAGGEERRDTGVPGRHPCFLLPYLTHSQRLFLHSTKSHKSRMRKSNSIEEKKCAAAPALFLQERFVVGLNLTNGDNQLSRREERLEGLCDEICFT